MGIQSVDGCRGRIKWANEYCYDTHFCYFGFAVFNLALSNPVHVFGPGGESAAGRLFIDLRPDFWFTFRTYLRSLCLGIGVLLFIAAIFCFVPGKPVVRQGGLGMPELGGLLFLLAAICVAIGFVPLEGNRHKNIRYLLGQHAWGNSDPATWSSRLCNLIRDPRGISAADSFADMARQSIKAEEWAQAMWAARLCCAVENRSAGERLTTAILSFPQVQVLLTKVRAHPRERDVHFGPCFPLDTWVRGDIGGMVRYITGGY